MLIGRPGSAKTCSGLLPTDLVHSRDVHVYNILICLLFQTIVSGGQNSKLVRLRDDRGVHVLTSHDLRHVCRRHDRLPGANI